MSKNIANPRPPAREPDDERDNAWLAAQLERELLRLGRYGGTLSLVTTEVTERRRLAATLGDDVLDRLDGLLGKSLRELLEACDSLSETVPGRYVILLPGMGQLRTQRFARSVQAAFVEAARPCFPTGGAAGDSAACAFGILTVGQEREPRAPQLLQRAEAALDTALKQREGYIHQEISGTADHGATLVHSGEKRFLFFGGDPT